MITDSNAINEVLKLTKTNYPLFAEYCSFLDNGLRKKALQALDLFLENTQKWNNTTKIDFCKTLFSASDRANINIGFILTHNLLEKLVQPALLQITIQEPQNYIAFKWYGEYLNDIHFLKKAYELNSTDYSTKITLLKSLEKDIGISTHHLPQYYLGNLEEDENHLQLAFSILEQLDNATKFSFLDRFEEFKSLINNYKKASNK